MFTSPSIRREIEARIDHLSSKRDALTCDADVHISDPDMIRETFGARLAEEPNYFHGRPIDGPMLLKEMDQAGVDLALCWQNPSVTVYSEDAAENREQLSRANRYIAEFARAHPDRIYPAGWTDPKAMGVEHARAIAEECVREFGFSIVKLNPGQNAYPIDSEMVFEVVDRIVELGAVPAFHYGADTPYTPVEGLENLASRYPDHPVLAVHFGGGGAGYVEAERQYALSRALGLRMPNLHFIQSAKRDTHIESDLITYRLAGPDHWRRIFLASDAPYGRQSWNFGGYRAMFHTLADGANHTDERLRGNPAMFDDNVIQDFFGRNFADFGIAACRRIIEANPGS